MRRFRNPRYAPEALERKLHPSGIGLPVTAEYAPATNADSAPALTNGGDTSFAGSPAPTFALSCALASSPADPPAEPDPLPPPPKHPTPWGGPNCPTDPGEPA